MSVQTSFDHSASRATRYDQLDVMCPALLDESDVVANQANFAALIREAFDWHWVGFYRVSGDELVLGPFQGPVACTRLQRGRGVCAAAWEKGEAIVVPDVEAFPGHVACSPFSRSELVLPVHDADRTVQAVFDIDSTAIADFDEEDVARLQKLLHDHSHRFIGRHDG